MTLKFGQKGKIEQDLAELHPSKMLVGVDEVGRGCIAGPVFAAAVALNYKKLKSLAPPHLAQIRDSKTLSARQRQSIQSTITSIADFYMVGSASTFEIESLGIVSATFLAMQRALEPCKSKKVVLVDGNQKISGYIGTQIPLVKGDALCYCISAASILAKIARDQYMAHEAAQYPHYCFETNVGYGTKAHIEAINKYGPCPLHRKNFSPIKELYLS